MSLPRLERVAPVPLPRPADRIGRFDARFADDEELGQAALRNAVPKYRDEEVWAQITSPETIERTLATLLCMRDVNLAAVHRHRAVLEDERLRTLELGAAGRVAWRRALAEYRRWRVGSGNFGRAVDRALSEVRVALSRLDRDDEFMRASARKHRSRTHRMEAAIREHRDATRRNDIDPEPHDYKLWGSLDH